MVLLEVLQTRYFCAQLACQFAYLAWLAGKQREQQNTLRFCLPLWPRKPLIARGGTATLLLAFFMKERLHAFAGGTPIQRSGL